MRQMVISISGLCMLAAFCSNLMEKTRFGNAVRLALGLEIARIVLRFVEDAVASILNWS